MRDIVIVGCGGFGREVHDVIDDINRVTPTWNVLGYASDVPNDPNTPLVEMRGSRLLGTTEHVVQTLKATYVIAIGDPAVRERVDERFIEAGWEAATLIHPDTTIGSHTTLGAGSVVCSGVRMTTNISIGRHAHLNLNSTIGHDCVLGDYLSVNPLVSISGNVVTGKCVMFGTNSTILQKLSVGDYSTVGASACVVKDVPSKVVVKGIPAK